MSVIFTSPTTGNTRTVPDVLAHQYDSHPLWQRVEPVAEATGTETTVEVGQEPGDGSQDTTTDPAPTRAPRTRKPKE